MASTKITVNHNGSIRIEGDFEIVDPDGKPFGLAGRSVISLCRCGHSANKPFCDGSHKTSGFADTVAAPELPPPKAELYGSRALPPDCFGCRECLRLRRPVAPSR